MGRIGKRFLTVCFLSIIFIFGATTLIKIGSSFTNAVLESRFYELPNRFEDIFTDNFKSRNNWINVNGLFQRLIGITLIRDAGDIDVYRMKNGQLTYLYPDNDMEYAVEKTSGLAEFVENMGAEFLYVQLPCKAYSDELMPAGSHTYAYEDADELIFQIKERNVEVLDLREEIKKSKKNTSELFFNTDHHWKPSTALWAAGLISSKLKTHIEGYEYDAGVYNIDNYECDNYEDWFLGSLGRRTGIFFGGVDDFEVIRPKFETDFYLYTESQTDGRVKEKKGDFSDALLSLRYLKKKDYFSNLTYFTYMGNEYRLSKVINHFAPNDKKILLLRDSFSCTLLPFLSLSAAEITAIDMRYYDNLQLEEYIENNSFDAVLVAYNPSMFREPEAFEFER